MNMLTYNPFTHLPRLLLAAVLLAPSATVMAEKSSSDEEPMRVYRLGNSHTNSVYEEFVGLVGAIGHPFKHDQHTVAGAPIWWLHQRSPRTSIEDLKNNPWDVVIFQTYNSTTDNEKKAITDYVTAAREGNPEVRVILYTIWPRDQSLTLLPGDEWFNEEDLAGEWGRYEGWTEEVAAHLREQFPDLDVTVAPTGLVIRMIGGMANAGLIPGLTSYADLTQDAGHMGLYGGYAIGATFASMIWDESPIGYPHQMLEHRGGSFRDEVALEVNPESALAMQQIIWDILAEYEHDGIDTGLWINTGRMVPALVGKPYDRPIPVVNASADTAYEISAGELPAGIALRGGRLTGTPGQPGLYEFTVAATQGGTRVERDILLPVEEERPLAVQTFARRLQADEYLQDPVEATGAIGKPIWKLTGGELPSGLTLLPSGLIKGTPAEQGTFEATVEATDRHPEDPRSASGTLRFEVGPPSEGTVVVPIVDFTWDRGAPLAEQPELLERLSFDHPITDSEGNLVAEFALVAYRGNERFREKRPEMFGKLLFVVRIADENSLGYPMESVHIHLDTNHTREVIYNEDDEHWMIDRSSGRRSLLQGYRPQRILRSTAEETEYGWIAIATHSMPSGFGVHNLTTPVTYGFNVAVGAQDDPERRYYWKGDASTVKDTSNFGSILIPDVQKQ